jgi:hypothetical protein
MGKSSVTDQTVAIMKQKEKSRIPYFSFALSIIVSPFVAGLKLYDPLSKLEIRSKT